MNTLNCKGQLLDLSSPKIMGVLNMTPDSFYDGGMYVHLDNAMKNVEKMILEGADIIDVGGMSSRPGAEIISVEKELSRVLPVISAIAVRYPNQLISIDTVHGEVAKKAIDAGASIVNDISGGSIDSGIYQVCIDERVPYVLMHIQGKPENMQDNPSYENVTLDILSYLKQKVYELRKMGMKDIVVDPGFGFGKTIEQNYELLRKMNVFNILECPILAGVSRKSMIYKYLNITPQEALNGTSIANTYALINGAKILRVHDVNEAKECLQLFEIMSKK